jgi:hypothetical protein
MKKHILLILLCLLSTFTCFAQKENEEEENEGKPQKLSVSIGVTHIPSAFEDGKENKSVFVPTIGIDYFYRFKERWAIGAVLDFELANYVVDFGRDELKREKALVTAIMVGYEFAKNWGLAVGPGVEFEKNKNLFVLRAGVEHEFKLDENWGLFPSINFDFKEEYSTWSLNIGVSRRL